MPKKAATPTPADEKPKKNKSQREQNREKLNDIVSKFNKSDDVTKPVMFWGKDMKPRQFVPTGIANLDSIMGGGIAKNTYTVVYGPEKVGKSSLAALVAASFQKNCPDQFVVWLDIEKTAEDDWLTKQGVNVKDLVLVRGGVFEEDMQRVLDLMKTGGVSLVIVDSVQALARMADIQKAAKPDKSAGETGSSKSREILLTEEARMGGHGAALSRFFRVATTYMNEDIAMFLIGQVRDNQDSYSSIKDYMPGGRAIQHYAGSRIKLSRVYSKDKAPKSPDGKKIIGFPSRMVLEKTKFSDQDGARVDINFLFGIGFDEFESNIDQAVTCEYVLRSGAWFTIPGLKKPVQGRASVSQHFKDNPEEYNKMLEVISGGFSDKEESEEDEQPVSKDD